LRAPELDFKVCSCEVRFSCYSDYHGRIEHLSDTRKALRLLFENCLVPYDTVWYILDLNFISNVENELKWKRELTIETNQLLDTGSLRGFAS
jgi:hypothetical protein